MENTDKTLLVLLYAIFAFAIVLHVSLIVKRERRIGLNSFFEFYLFLVYGITPIVTLLSMDTLKEGNNYFFTDNSLYYYWLYFMSVLFYVFYRLTNYVLKRSRYKDKKNLSKWKIDITSNRFFVITMIISLIGILSLVLWTKAYGYPWDIIHYANAIRSGNSPIYNQFSFVKPLCGFVIIAFYNNLIIFKKTNHKILNSFLLVINGFFSIIYLLANDSRMFILVFFLCVILFYKNRNVHINLKNVLFYTSLIIVTLLALAKLDGVTYFIRNGEELKDSSSSLMLDAMSEFSYTYRNGVNVLYLYDNAQITGPHEPIDLKNIVTFLLPERLNMDKEDLTRLNTSFYHNISGSVPTDIITASIYKFHLLGIIVLPIFIAFVLNWLENLFRRYDSDFMWMIYNIIGCNVCLRFVGYYDLSNNLRSCIYIIVPVIMVCTVCKSRLKGDEVRNE